MTIIFVEKTGVVAPQNFKSKKQNQFILFQKIIMTLFSLVNEEIAARAIYRTPKMIVMHFRRAIFFL